jgi:hypothetical protein
LLLSIKLLLLLLLFIWLLLHKLFPNDLREDFSPSSKLDLVGEIWEE